MSLIFSVYCKSMLTNVVRCYRSVIIFRSTVSSSDSVSLSSSFIFCPSWLSLSLFVFHSYVYFSCRVLYNHAFSNGYGTLVLSAGMEWLRSVVQYNRRSSCQQSTWCSDSVTVYTPAHTFLLCPLKVFSGWIVRSLSVPEACSLHIHRLTSIVPHSAEL